MDILQCLLNLIVPVVCMCTLLLLWPALTIRSLVLRCMGAIFEENMRGKVVVITGASSGIGEHVAYQYSKRGAILVLIARRDDKLRSVSDHCVKLGAMDVRAIRADVSHEDDCRRFIEDTVNQYGRLDHLVNNASVSQSFLFEEAESTTPMTKIMATDFWGYVYPTFYALNHLKHSKGKIIAVASVSSWNPLPRLTIYNAAKAAIFSFFETLRVELGSTIGGITLAAPGFTESEMLMGKYVNKKGDMEWNEEQRDVSFGPVPVQQVQDCAKDIVRGAVRGRRYVRTPFWSTMFLLFRLLTPEFVDFMLHLQYVFPMPGRNDGAPLSKVMSEIPCMKAIFFPSSMKNVQQQLQRGATK